MSSQGRYSLRFSLGSAFLGLVVITSFLLGFSTYYSVRSFIREDIRQRLHDLASVTALQISGEDHNRIMSSEDEHSEPYLKIRRFLRQVRERSPGIHFIYTMRQNSDGRVVFVVDAEEDMEQFSHVGDEYEDLTPPMIAAFTPPFATHVEKVFSHDEWGVWLSGFAPILNHDGSLEGIVGIDFSARQILDYEQRFLSVIILLCLTITVVALLVGFFFSQLISRPLLILTKEMGKIQRFILDSDLNFASRVTEVVQMKTAVENMKSGLRSFRKYVPAELVGDLIKLGKEAELGSEQAEVTVFFSDIADFTTISEEMPPEELAENMRSYFEGMTAAILTSGGTVDKYIGDAIMAFWGAPHPLEDHAVMACRAALQCQEYLKEINREWAGRGVPEMRTRIGLNTGDAIVGNFGYEQRFNYTAMGDNVNLASRLEGLNKYYGTDIIISEYTHAQAASVIEARLLDVVAVKGKTRGIVLYELVGLKGELPEAEKAFIEMFNSGSGYYRDREWARAKDIFVETLRQRPEDRPSRILLQRCSDYLVKPPPEDWTGVIVLREK